jgi:hypothetical protein
MGKDAVTMKTSIKHKNLKFWYKIIPLNGIEYNFFLQSEDPAIKVFAILANFGNDDIEKVLENIFQQINATADGNLTEEKHINQLRVLVQLCNDNVKLKFEHMISTRTFFKVKEDAFYKIGREEGKVEGKVETAIRLKELGCDMELISKAFNIPVSEVEKLISEAGK